MHATRGRRRRALLRYTSAWPSGRRVDGIADAGRVTPRRPPRIEAPCPHHLIGTQSAISSDRQAEVAVDGGRRVSKLDQRRGGTCISFAPSQPAEPSPTGTQSAGWRRTLSALPGAHGVIPTQPLGHSPALSRCCYKPHAHRCHNLSSPIPAKTKTHPQWLSLRRTVSDAAQACTHAHTLTPRPAQSAAPSPPPRPSTPPRASTPTSTASRRTGPAQRTRARPCSLCTTCSALVLRSSKVSAATTTALASATQGRWTGGG